MIPSTGVTPLNVQVVNTSENATIFNWYLNGDSLGENPPTIFDTAGTYQLELIASNGIYECIDSITQTVFVYDSVIVNLPNVFTPNNDDVNDFFSITVNHEVNVRLSVLNRWGNVVFTWEGVLKTGVNDIWDGTTKGIFQKQQTTDGTYFYKLEILDDIPVNEKVSNGFVEVRR